MKPESARQIALDRIRAMALHMRRTAVDVAAAAGGKAAHIGGGLSLIDITATLYGGVMRVDPADPQNPDRDRFILSKGHGVLGFYTALEARGFISREELMTFENTGSFLLGHPTINRARGVEFSNGSLGMGLGLGIGVALALRRRASRARVFVALGDGECNEGSVWEAVMAAAHFRLDNIVAIVDRNKFQQTGSNEAILEPGDMAAKWRVFGWHVVEADGHDVGALYDALTAAAEPGKPLAIIAHTVKGKGLSFAEGNNDWHHAILTAAQHQAALAELGADLP